MRKAFSLGWPGGLVIAALLLYFQFGRKNDPRQGELVFKTIVGLLGYSMIFIAIANYATNFNDESVGAPGEPRFLPVSLVMFTVACFTMAMYFKGVRVLLQIGGFMFFVAAGLAGFGNWLPQVKADPPPAEEQTADVRQMSVQERADLGEKIIFGAVGASNTQGAIGKGQCPLCHGFQKGFLSERAPNLFGIPKRALEQMKDPRYSQNDPSKRDTMQKEACPGCGTASTAAEYIAESHACPNCYVVVEFGVKGTNDRESPMPAIHKPPIGLTFDELIAVDTWLFAREGVEPPSPEEIENAYKKFVPEADRPKAAPAGGAPAGGPVPGAPVVTGDEPVNEIFTKALCFVCHTIPGVDVAKGVLGPKLVERTNAPLRLKDPAYKGKATSVREYIMESIITPSAYVVKPFPDKIMPQDFGKKLNAAAINKIIDYLAQLEEGKEPPKIK
jgi:cytochrome c2